MTVAIMDRTAMKEYEKPKAVYTDMSSGKFSDFAEHRVIEFRARCACDWDQGFLGKHVASQRERGEVEEKKED